MAEHVDSLAAQWVQHRVRAGLIRPRTGRAQRGHLDFFIAAHGANKTMRADRRVFARWLENIGHLAASSRRLHLSTVRGFVTWAAAEGHVPLRALTLIPKVKAPRSIPRAINADAAAQLIRSLDTQQKRITIGLMIWCGLRRGEVARLKTEDVDERGATLFVVGKSQHERLIPIPPELAPIVKCWLDMRRRVPGPLIPSVHGGHYDPSTIGTQVSRWMRSAGVKIASHDGRSGHSLRHSFASDVLDRGASITVVQALLGHQHLATTSIYLRVARLEDLRAAVSGRNYAA